MATTISRPMMLHHLQYNHYPPVPAEMVGVCLAVVDHYAETQPDGVEFYTDGEESEKRFGLPHPLRWKDGQTTAPAEAIAEAFHLWDIIEYERHERYGEPV